MKFRYALGALLLISTTAACGSATSPAPSGTTSPSCLVAVSPDSQSVPSSGGVFTSTVTAASGCSWNTTANEPWISVTGGGSGGGTDVITYSVDANVGRSARNGEIDISWNGGSSSITVSQSGH
jgi:ABC-type phosphate transport system substrate-binding protein